MLSHTFKHRKYFGSCCHCSSDKAAAPAPLATVRCTRSSVNEYIQYFLLMCEKFISFVRYMRRIKSLRSAVRLSDTITENLWTRLKRASKRAEYLPHSQPWRTICDKRLKCHFHSFQLPCERQNRKKAPAFNSHISLVIGCVCVCHRNWLCTTVLDAPNFFWHVARKLSIYRWPHNAKCLL